MLAPQATFDGELLHKSVEAAGAAYLYYLCQNHPFVDGNRRTAARAALVFLDAHGFELSATIDELDALVLGVASSQLDKSDIVTWLRARSGKTAT